MVTIKKVIVVLVTLLAVISFLTSTVNAQSRFEVVFKKDTVVTIKRTGVFLDIRTAAERYDYEKRVKEFTEKYPNIDSLMKASKREKDSAYAMHREAVKTVENARLLSDSVTTSYKQVSKELRHALVYEISNHNKTKRRYTTFRKWTFVVGAGTAVALTVNYLTRKE